MLPDVRIVPSIVVIFESIIFCPKMWDYEIFLQSEDFWPETSGSKCWISITIVERWSKTRIVMHKLPVYLNLNYTCGLSLNVT